METTIQELDKAVDAYLSSGRLISSDVTAIAQACEDRIRRESQKSLKSAMKLAQRFDHQAGDRQLPMSLYAQRALARVSHLSARFEEAERAYLSVHALAGNDFLLRARVDRALIDVYMYLGRFDESRRRGRSALTQFRRHNLPAEVAMTQVNLANMLHRQDRHREAEKLYAAAAQYFEGTGDEVSLARCYYNRANTLLQLFEIDEAETLYSRSFDLYVKHGHHLDATDARYGLAWLRMLTGKMHIALTELAECESAYREFAQPKGEALCVLDLAEVYLNLNLFSDAAESARIAEGKFRTLGLEYERAKAAFFLAKALASQTEIPAARAAIVRAETGMTKSKNFGFLGALALLRTELLSEHHRHRELVRARRLFAKAQLPIWEAICDLYAIAQGDSVSRTMQRLKRNPAIQHVPHLYAWWQTLSGDQALLAGDPELARQHWKMAADRLDSVKAQLPPVELRSHFGSQGSPPHLRLVKALLEEDPRQAAAWSERYKTAGVWASVALDTGLDEQRLRVEKSLADLASRVAAASQRLGGLSAERSAVGSTAQRGIAAMQKRVRLELARVDRDSEGSIDPVEQLLSEMESTSRRLPVLQFHLSDDDLIAFIHEDGATRMHRYLGGRAMVDSLMQQWRFLMEGELLSQALPTKCDNAGEVRLFAKAADVLWSPLELSSSAKRFLVLPEGELANFPWSAILVDGHPLLERHQFVLAPSLRHCTHARNRTIKSERVLAFAGNAQNLPGVGRELEVLGALAKTDYTGYSPAKRADWPVSGEARICHYSGHAHLRPENPFYSYLLLTDGPLFAADFRMRNLSVGLMTVAACRSGEQVAVPGEESNGLVRALLEMGAKNVVAGAWPVSDKSTVLWMTTFYERYFAGSSLADSFRGAALSVRDKFPAVYHWGAWGIHGSDEPV